MNRDRLCDCRPVRSSETRAAVESAIESSKLDRSITWEQAVNQSLRGISRWEDNLDEEDCNCNSK